MKTFKTEKNNIPEGATHYVNETSFFHFSWGKYVNAELELCHPNGAWTLVDEKIFANAIKPIPKPETTEWNGEGLPPVGVECEVRFRDDGEWTDWFANSKFKAGYGSKLWFSHEFGECVYPAHDVEFRKPESPEEKEKRERLEAAYDLYCLYAKMVDWPIVSIDDFKENHPDKDAMLAIVDKTNYRKGE